MFQYGCPKKNIKLYLLILLIVYIIVNVYIENFTPTLHPVDDISLTPHRHAHYLTPEDEIDFEDHRFVRRKDIKTHYPLTIKTRFIINNPQICIQYEYVSCIFMVHTSVNNIQKRMDIRRTWLNSTHFSPEQIRTIFLVGIPLNKTIQKSLEEENELFHDIVQGEFVDTYHNLTLKGVMGLRWISEYCMNAKLVIKVDDDIFLNSFVFFEYFFPYLKGKRRFIGGRVLKRSKIIRDVDSKWFVDFDHFKDMGYFPYRYCSGLAVFISTDIIPELYHAASIAPFFWVDDLYLFGILPSKLQPPPNFINLKPFYTLDYFAGYRCLRKAGSHCKYLVTLLDDHHSVKKIWKAAIADRIQGPIGSFYMDLNK